MSFFDIFKKRKSQDIPAAEEKEPVFEEISFEEKAPYTDTLAGASESFSQLEKDVDEFLSKDEPQIITLYDEKGRETDFLLVDTVNYKNKNYVILIEEKAARKGEGDVTILEEISSNDGFELRGVEDTKILDKIFGIFMKNNNGRMEFEV